MKVVFALGRIALVLIFIVSGAQKLIDIAGTADQIQSKLNIPAALNDMEAATGMPIWQILAITAALLELVAGLLIVFDDVLSLSHI
jgi:putative oxidoreductase